MNLPIQNECAAFAERALRQIMARLRDAQNMSAHEEHVLRGCIKTCEEILAIQSRLSAKAQSREKEHQRESQSCVDPSSRDQKILLEARNFVESVHAKNVNQEVTALVFDWQKRVDAQMIAWQWKFLERARMVLAEKQVEWDQVSARGNASQGGIWSKVRAYRLAGKVSANQAVLEKEQRCLSDIRAQISLELGSGKTLAGMAAVHLKLLKHAHKCEHRVIRKVLELDAEVQVRAVLQENLHDLEARLGEARQSALEFRESLMDAIGEHALCEEKKSQRMLLSNEKRSVLPLEKMTAYTHKQIEKCYEPLHDFVEMQLAAIQRDEFEKEKLKQEFSRLMGVVHEYKLESEPEKTNDNRSIGASKGAQRTARDDEGICCH